MCLSNLILITPTELSHTTPQSLTTSKGPTEGTTKPGAKYSYTSDQLKEIRIHTKPTSLTSLPFGTIRTIQELNLNNKTRKPRNKKSKSTAQGIDIQNLRQIET